MESRIQPELELRRKVCESCGESIFEFAPEVQELERYICTNCSAA